MNIITTRSGRHRAAPVLAVAVGFGMFGSVFAAQGAPRIANGDVTRGWRVFNQKQCIDCHAIWGQGGNVAPDLGRIRQGRPTRGELAGIMWNHIPRMLARMKQAGQPPVRMTPDEMADVFALINFARQLDEPGDPAQGEKILRTKGCTQCHSIDMVGGTVGPDLAKWGSYANPIIWAQRMWEHAPMMEETMQRSEIQWPKLEGSDLVHIVAYVRSAGLTGKKTYLRPGSVERGRPLFSEKRCNTCHPGEGPDLAAVSLPDSQAALASRMWNHSPEMTRVMREKAVERQPLTPQELADILSYILMLQRQDRDADPVRGRVVFAKKGCTQCHEGDGVGPAMAKLGEAAAPAKMAAAMWNHGESMLDRMTEAGMTWPVFNEHEMVDLLAYLRAQGADGQGSPDQPTDRENAAAKEP